MHDDSRPLDQNAHDPERDAPEGDTPQWDAFARYVAGECDPVEARAVEAWLADQPLDAQLAETVKAHAERAEQSAELTVDVEGALASLRPRLTDAAPILTVVRGGAPRLTQTATAPKSRSGRYLVAAAAVMVAVVGVQSWRSSAAAPSAARTVATAIGQRDSLTLSDGTKVVLAPGSTLTVAAGFDNGERSVVLDGAAFFEVQHDAAHPFTVRAANAEIRDIGTAFTVKTDAAGVLVTVTHGIVAMRATSAATPGSAPNGAMELRAGDRGVLSRGSVAVTHGTVMPEDISWTRGQLSYRDASLSEVQADLKRWYGLSLQVADSTLLRYTVTMPAQTDSARIVSMVAAILGADVEQHGDTVILHSAGRSTTP